MKAGTIRRNGISRHLRASLEFFPYLRDYLICNRFLKFHWMHVERKCFKGNRKRMDGVFFCFKWIDFDELNNLCIEKSLILTQRNSFFLKISLIMATRAFILVLRKKIQRKPSPVGSILGEPWMLWPLLVLFCLQSFARVYSKLHALRIECSSWFPIQLGIASGRRQHFLLFLLVCFVVSVTLLSYIFLFVNCVLSNMSFLSSLYLFSSFLHFQFLGFEDQPHVSPRIHFVLRCCCCVSLVSL